MPTAASLVPVNIISHLTGYLTPAPVTLQFALNTTTRVILLIMSQILYPLYKPSSGYLVQSGQKSKFLQKLVICYSPTLSPTHHSSTQFHRRWSPLFHQYTRHVSTSGAYTRVKHCSSGQLCYPFPELSPDPDYSSLNCFIFSLSLVSPFKILNNELIFTVYWFGVFCFVYLFVFSVCPTKR